MCFPANVSSFISCPPTVTTYHNQTNHPGLPPKVLPPWNSHGPKHMGLVIQHSHHSHWWKSPPGWPKEVTKGAWQTSVMWDKEDLLKELWEVLGRNFPPNVYASSVWLKSLFLGQRAWTTIGRTFTHLWMMRWRSFQSKALHAAGYFPLPGRYTAA